MYQKWKFLKLKTVTVWPWWVRRGQVCIRERGDGQCPSWCTRPWSTAQLENTRHGNHIQNAQIELRDWNDRWNNLWSPILSCKLEIESMYKLWYASFMFYHIRNWIEYRGVYIHIGLKITYRRLSWTRCAGEYLVYHEPAELASTLFAILSKLISFSFLRNLMMAESMMARRRSNRWARSWAWSDNCNRLRLTIWTSRTITLTQRK